MPKGVYVRTEYHRKINSEGHKGGTPWNKGKTGVYSKETLESIGLASKKHWESQEYKEKMSKRFHGSHSPERRANARAFFIGENNPNWKEEPGYSSVHAWVRRHRGAPKKCSLCLTDKNMQWANKDHTYKRVLSDYIELCSKCHHKYDRENNGKKNRWDALDRGAEKMGK